MDPDQGPTVTEAFAAQQRGDLKHMQQLLSQVTDSEHLEGKVRGQYEFLLGQLARSKDDLVEAIARFEESLRHDASSGQAAFTLVRLAEAQLTHGHVEAAKETIATARLGEVSQFVGVLLGELELCIEEGKA